LTRRIVTLSLNRTRTSARKTSVAVRTTISNMIAGFLRQGEDDWLTPQKTRVHLPGTTLRDRGHNTRTTNFDHLSLRLGSGQQRNVDQIGAAILALSVTRDGQVIRFEAQRFFQVFLRLRQRQPRLAINGPCFERSFTNRAHVLFMLLVTAHPRPACEDSSSQGSKPRLRLPSRGEPVLRRCGSSIFPAEGRNKGLAEPTP
jgi:hypothetical protein